MLGQTSDPIDLGERPIMFYAYCDDVADFRAKLLESGVEAGDGYAVMISHTWIMHARSTRPP